MSTYLHGQATDRQTAQGAHVPAGVRPLPLLRPHREGSGGPFRDRRKKRLLLHGVAGAQGVHPSRPEIPPPDRVPRGGGASCPPARKGGQHGRSPHLRRGLRSRPVAGDRRGRGNRGRRRRRGGHGQEDPPPERRNPSRARQPRLCPPRRAERVPVLPDRGESRRRFPETVERRRPPCPVARPIRRSSFPPPRISSPPPPFACVPRRGISPASSGRAPTGWGRRPPPPPPPPRAPTPKTQPPNSTTSPT